MANLTEQEKKIKNVLFGGDKNGKFPTNAQELAQGSGEPLEVVVEFLAKEGY